MRIPAERHTELAVAHHWRVASLASDFQLLDVWRFPIVAPTDVPLREFIEVMAGVQQELASTGAAGALFRVRAAMGRVLGWDIREDGERKALPIPGCVETSLRDRLTHDDAGASLPLDDAPAIASFAPVYHSQEEWLLEISNATVHALMHFGREPLSDQQWSPQLAVYVKPRGRLGPLYMAAIAPFRHYIVYPTMMRSAKRAWERRATANPHPPHLQ